jgi:hypothetical protein
MILAFWGSTGLPQELNLFQAVDIPANDPESDRSPQRSGSRNNSTSFTLVGTSRFGDKYKVSLLSSDGKPTLVEWKKNTTSEINGYRNYKIIDVGARTVTIDYPDGETCVDDESKGVKCNGSYALLSFKSGAPLLQDRIPAQISPPNDEPQSDEGLVDIETSEDGRRMFMNPFSGEIQEIPQLSAEEQAVRDERRARRAEQFRNFEIVRIPDDEIPEGMQRIRTPFGDRLEPEGTVEE